MSNMYIFCEPTIGISWLPCVLNMPQVVSLTVKQVNLEVSDSVNSFNFAMCVFTRKCYPVGLVSYPDGWWRTWWQTMEMMPRLLVFSIVQCKLDYHDGAWLESFHKMWRFEAAFSVVREAINIICQVWLNESWLKIDLFWDDIITSSKKLFTEFESDMAVGNWMLHNLSWVMVTSFATM